MTAALHAEWTKLRTVAGPGGLLLAAIALTAAVGAAAANATSCPGGGCQVDPAKVSLTGIYLGQAIVAAVAVTAISGEYSTGMIRLTLTATPRRWLVLAAKAAVVGAATLVTGAVAVLASVLAGRLLLDGHGIDAAHGYQALSPANGSVLRAAAGSVLYLGLIWSRCRFQSASPTTPATIGNRYSKPSTTPIATAESRTAVAMPRLSSAISVRYSTDPAAARSTGPLASDRVW